MTGAIACWPSERLPRTDGLRHEVPVQIPGHLVGYGASLQQTIELTGARGCCRWAPSSGVQDYQLADTITECTACAWCSWSRT